MIARSGIVLLMLVSNTLSRSVTDTPRTLYDVVYDPAWSTAHSGDGENTVSSDTETYDDVSNLPNSRLRRWNNAPQEAEELQSVGSDTDELRTGEQGFEGGNVTSEVEDTKYGYGFQPAYSYNQYQPYSYSQQYLPSYVIHAAPAPATPATAAPAPATPATAAPAPATPATAAPAPATPATAATTTPLPLTTLPAQSICSLLQRGTGITEPTARTTFITSCQELLSLSGTTTPVPVQTICAATGRNTGLTGDALATYITYCTSVFAIQAAG